MDYGYFDSGNFTPEEMIIAAGLVPKRILGDSAITTTVEADKYLEPNLCYFARNLLNQAITGNLKNLAGILFTHGCDCTSRQYDVWKVHADVKDLYYLNVPLKRDKIALKFLLKELNRFKSHLEKISGNTITNEKLEVAIDQCNETRSLLRELYRFCKNSSPVLTGSEFFRVIVKAQTLEKAVANELIHAKLQEVKQRVPTGGKKFHVLLTGTPLDYPDFIELVESCDLDVVGVAFSMGSDYFARDVEKTGDPIGDIARFLVAKPPNPTKHPPDPFLDFVLDEVKEVQADGIIYQALKFCEPYLYDSVYILNRFKEEGIPALFLEHEYTTQGLASLRTRIEAFKEILGGTK
ncbi:MAG: 2-hydroxyglutaryl-CoA dehydratase D-component [Promethearchaeota archaeon CR_4]|nr:MAG: 2-hydroxyglutaryl-CoA dehydratase D-component [Candidatus Lokiarchaeota archaeon CR_4]